MFNGGFPNRFNGLDITVSTDAVEKVFRWPEKRRSKRLHKKMTKKLGKQIFMKPSIFKTPYGIIVHPELYAQLKERMK